MDRRHFISKATSLAAGTLVGQGLTETHGAPTDTWGKLPDGFTPGQRPSYKVLEIHLYGGLSPWETFYVRPNLGWRGFEGKVQAAQWERPGGSDICRFTSTGPAATREFDLSDSGHPIHLGPATSPLWDERILSRMRVLVLQHDLLPHEAAVPYVATGLRLGRPQLAGMGAAVQRRRNAKNTELPEGQQRRTPTAFICLPDAASDNIEAFSATGLLGGAARPIELKIGGGTRLLDLLERRPVLDSDGTTRSVDRMMAAYQDSYARLMTPPSVAIPARARGFAEYTATARMLANAPDIRAMLSRDLFDRLDDRACVHVLPATADPTQQVNQPRMSLTCAAALLGLPRDADYVCVVDGGLTGNVGYDTHSAFHVENTFKNLYNTLASLRGLIESRMIDLDSTLVLISTEFGRTPAPNGDGRDHWPQGYVVAMIGGPIAPFESAAARPRVLGRINDNKAIAEEFYTATYVRAAALLAAGINPFTGDYINLGDLSSRLHPGGADHLETIRKIKSDLFGVRAS